MITLLNTLRYRWSPKSEPVFSNPQKTITDFSELTPKTRSPYDMQGRQCYLAGPSSTGFFHCGRLSPEQITELESKYAKEYEPNPAPAHQYPWVYWSMACNSFDKFRIDIYHPGRIVSKCTFPKYSWPSIWFYLSMNKSDWSKDLLPIDKQHLGEFYFEIDTFELQMNPDQAMFTGHYGTQTDRRMKASHLYWKWDNAWHYPEVRWDGQGNFTWYLDSVLVHRANIPLPACGAYPYLKLTLAMAGDYPDIQYPITWKAEYVKIDGIINL